MSETAYELSNPAYRDALEGFLNNPQVMIEITSICNFACTYCLSPHKPRVKKMMEPALFSHIASQLPSVTSRAVYLHIDGEPTLHPRFAEYAREVNGYGLPVGLATNGSLLRAEYLDLWMDLLISMSTSPEELAERHSKLDFAKYSQTIADYTAAWARTDCRQDLFFQIVYYRHPGDEDYAEYDAAKNASIARFIERTGLAEYCEVSSPIESQIPRLRKKKGGRVASFLKEVVVGGGMYPVAGKLLDGPQAAEGFCDSAWKRLTIQSDGTISCCCVDLTGGTAFADPSEIWRVPLGEIWKKHAGIRSMRDAFLETRVEREVCRKCLGHAEPPIHYVAPPAFPIPA